MLGLEMVLTGTTVDIVSGYDAGIAVSVDYYHLQSLFRRFLVCCNKFAQLIFDEAGLFT